ncbi:MAG: polyprenyl synthetase family protein, partial [Crocinitomicaceae bacterium]
ASLISTCCEAGAISVEANEHRNRMKEFGEMVGMAFQIKDDIFDYGSPGNIGKPTGIDIREQKMTLPLIYTLNHSDKASRAELMNIIKNKHEDSKQIARAVELVIQNGGIDYAFQKMNDFATKAIDLLEPLPESQAKKSLIGLVHYTINRDK